MFELCMIYFHFLMADTFLTGQALLTKVEGAVESTHEKHHGSSYQVVEKEVAKDVKGFMEQGLDLHGRNLRLLSSETTHTTNHAHGEEKSSHDHLVEHLALPSSGLLAGIEKPSNIIKRAKCSRYGNQIFLLLKDLVTNILPAYTVAHTFWEEVLLVEKLYMLLIISISLVLTLDFIDMHVQGQH